MKILLALCITVLSAGNINAAFLKDTIPASSELAISHNNELLKKSQRQQTVGWLLLGGGGIMAIAGSYIALTEFAGILTPEAKDKSNTIDFLVYGGLGLMSLSVPFIISGFKNRKKARLFIKNEPPDVNIRAAGIKPTTSLGIKIGF